MKNIIISTRRRPGFTLLEVMVVVAVLGAVTVIASPKIAGVFVKTKSTQCAVNRVIMERAEERYRFEHSGLPSASLDELRQTLYIDRVPKCSAGGQYIWISTANPVSMGCSVHNWPYPVPPAVAALYASDFNDMTGLKILMGGWSTASGSLVNITPNTESRVFFGTSTWKDYSLTATATLSSGNGYGIYYRADGKTNITGYCFQYDPGWHNTFVVRRVINGHEESQPFKSVSMPVGFPIYSTPHQITITVVGATQKIYVDNQLIMSFSDSTFISGGAGFRTWSGISAGFDSVQVTQL
ncbi:MAG: prepilin-type N-terminal cleavage/methylation domain-containing protein [Elusimicrobiota bacterium]